MGFKKEKSEHKASAKPSLFQYILCYLTLVVQVHPGSSAQQT